MVLGGNGDKGRLHWTIDDIRHRHNQVSERLINRLVGGIRKP